MDVHRLHHGALRRGQQPVEQALQSARFLDDDLGVFAQIAGFQLPFQQLGGAADAAQGIADLVGQLAQQRLAGLGLGHDLFVPGDAHVAGGGVQFDHCRAGGLVDGRDGGT